MNKFFKISVITVLITLSFAMLVGCNKPRPEDNVNVSDLVGIKINNYMAEWENPAYNFTYEGSNTLKVTVPYTKRLKITDLLTSPNSTAKVYQDAEYAKEIADINDIAIDKEKSLYINVQNSTKTDQQTRYKVDVKVEELKGITEEEKLTAAEDNRGGHIYIPESYTTITIDDITYQVIRTTSDYDNSIRVDKTANIILANDLYFESYKTFEFKDKEGFIDSYEGTFNGNNYAIIVDNFIPKDSTPNLISGLLSQNKGIMKNIIMRSNKATLVYNNLFAIANQGTIKNCVNYLNFDSEAGNNATIFGFFTTNNLGVLKNNINYGNFKSSYKLGPRVAAFAAENKNTNQMFNNINVGNLHSEGKCAGIVSGFLGKATEEEKYFFNYNLGKLSGDPIYQICEENKLIKKEYIIK